MRESIFKGSAQEEVLVRDSKLTLRVRGSATSIDRSILPARNMKKNLFDKSFASALETSNPSSQRIIGRICTFG